jgi:peptide/nickel transport system ATP-binding protein
MTDIAEQQRAVGSTDQVPVLECEDISRRYRIKSGLFRAPELIHAVNSVSLSVLRGEVLAIVGESGCGKTTLAKMLLGLLKPSSGTIRFSGMPINETPRALIARQVQPVFQDPYSSLNPRKTLGQIIGLPLLVHQIGKPSDRPKKISEIMDVVGLPPHLIHAYPNQLSGGQRQRVAIARTLVMEPEVIVCDEPTSALDVSVQAQILNLLQDLRRDLNLTYVFISHDLSVVKHMADRVAVMYLGRLVELGKTEQIFDRPRHPYTETLLKSILTPDPRQGLPSFHVDGGFPDPLNPPSGCYFHPRCPKCLDECTRLRPRLVSDKYGSVECHLHQNEVIT